MAVGIVMKLMTKEDKLRSLRSDLREAERYILTLEGATLPLTARLWRQHRDHVKTQIAWLEQESA